MTKYLLVQLIKNFICIFFSRVEPVQLAFIILGASMAALALIILVVGFLATGSTRHNVYRTTFGRTGGTVGMSTSIVPFSREINFTKKYHQISTT